MSEHKLLYNQKKKPVLFQLPDIEEEKIDEEFRLTLHLRNLLLKQGMMLLENPQIIVGLGFTNYSFSKSHNSSLKTGKYFECNAKILVPYPEKDFEDTD